MPLRFCANLNFLFCENGANIFEKIHLSKSAGFHGIEIAFPFQFTKEEVSAVQKENDMNVVLMNISLGEFILSMSWLTMFNYYYLSYGCNRI